MQLDLPDEWYKGLLQQLAPEVAAAGRKVAGNINEPDIPVNVHDKLDRNGRPVAMVVMAHPKAMATQAKRGSLTRAAAAAGLDVRRYAN